jgi:tetratricopeptide (TPR) repeat protein
MFPNLGVVPASLLLGLALGALASTTALGQGPLGEDLEKRLSAARRRAQVVKPDAPEATAVASELGDIGAAYLARGDTGRAVELLQEAYGWNPDNGLVLARLTLAYVRAENFPFARFYLDLAEERAPRAPPEAYAVLGEIYYSLNRVEDAVLAWEQFERLGGGDPRVLLRLARAREELSLSSNQKYREAGDFVFYFDSVIPAETVDRIGEKLAETSRQITAFIGAEPPGPQVVILYAGRAYFSLVSVPDWVSGVFDGKIRVSLDPDGGVTPQLQSVLSHELAHALIRQGSRDRAPGWLHEGLAQWWEGKRILRREFREALGGRSSRSLAEMEESLSRKADRATARAGYAEALGLIEYLLQERGPGSVTCILRDLADGLSISDALAKETGLSSEQLFSRWKTWANL